MTWHPPKPNGKPKGSIKKARARARKKKYKVQQGIVRLKIINPSSEQLEVVPGWTRAEMESAILSTASRSTSMRKFRWPVYGMKADMSLAVTVIDALGLTRYEHHINIGDLTFRLASNGHLVKSRRWGWRAR